MEPPPKRLRGWQLQRAMDEGPKAAGMEATASSSMGSSPLCTRLLELWSLGKISATQAAELSRLSRMCDREAEDMLQLAKCGNFGLQPGNTHRDMCTTFGKGIQLGEPHFLKVPVLDPNCKKVVQEDAALLLPHLLFSHLGHYYPNEFEELFCFKEAAAFWRGVEKTQDERLAEPLTLDKRVQNPQRTCPLYVHGDGAEYATRDSLMIWSWGSVVSKKSSLQSHLLLAAIPKSATVPTTWDPLNDWIAWSFTALLKGTHPLTDPYGQPLPPGSLSDLAGTPLTPGRHRAAIWCIQGDQEFHSNVLKVGHWTQRSPCHECDAQRPFFKKKACPEGKSVKLLRAQDQDYVLVSPQEALLAKRSPHPLFTIPGVSTAHVRGDMLHICYSKGVANHLLGSLLHYICYFDGPGSRQRVSPSARLQRLFSRVKELYQEWKVQSRLTNLRISMLCDPAKPHKNFPCLEAKAGETKHLMPCIWHLLGEVLDKEVGIHQKMMHCLRTLIELQDHYDAAGVFLNPEEYSTACNLAERFFSLYHDLKQWALLKGRKLFHVTYKFHSFMHLIQNSKHLNFRIHHNYRAEHFVGQMSELAHSVSFGVKASKLSTKIALKYKMLLHLQLTRPGFGAVDTDDEDDP